jgi:predicted lipoprotein with Yx(FWY)xxD motif
MPQGSNQEIIMVRHLFAPALAVLSLAAFPALSQQAGETIKVGQSQEYGQHLVDGEGRAVYLFTADDQGQGDTKEAVSNCYDSCAEAWPPVLSEAEPQAEGAAQSELLGRIERKDGDMQVTYNGWPLYYFIQDQDTGQAVGQDVKSFGGEWYLVRADGEKVGHE